PPRAKPARDGGSSGRPDDRAWDRGPCTRRRSCRGRAPSEARSARSSAAPRRIDGSSLPSSQIVLEGEAQSADRDLVPIAERGVSGRLVVHSHAIPPGCVADLVLRSDAADVQVVFGTAAGDAQIAALASP